MSPSIKSNAMTSVIIAIIGALAFVSCSALAQAPEKQKTAPQANRQGSPAQPTTQGTASAKASGSNDIVARVGDINISADDIRGYIAALDAREQSALAQDPALLSQAVRMLLANRLVLQEAQSKKWDQQPNVAAQIDRVRESALVELYLQSVSTPPANFPSNDDLQKVYDANRNVFLMPRQYQLAEILVPMGKDADKTAGEQAKKTIDDIQRKLKASGADFAAIATESGNRNGGNLGWVIESQIRPEIRSQVVALSKTTMTDPIRMDDGWHIIKLADTKDAYTRTLPEVRDQLSRQIRADRAKALRQAFLIELLKQHPPVLNELALSNLIEKPSK